MTEPQKLSVFLCHSPADKAAIRDLYTRLSKYPWIDPWLDEEKLLPGHDRNGEISKALEKAHVVIIGLSKDSITKEGRTQAEFKYALNIALEKTEGAIFIIPLILEDVTGLDIPRKLKDLQSEDYFPNKRRVVAFEKILKGLKSRADMLDIPLENSIPPVVDVRRDKPSHGPSAPKDTQKTIIGKEPFSILFLAADPTNAARLRLGEELREIQEKLQLSKERDRFNLQQRMSVRPEDISQALLDIQPQIIHFSGHGLSSGELCFENLSGQLFPIKPDALAALFEQFSDRVECVILNACYSETQAQAIGKHIGYVIGMNKQIGDKAAIAFAVGFYQALGAGRSIESSYKLGCIQIGLHGIDEHLTPVLLKKGNEL